MTGKVGTPASGAASSSKTRIRPVIKPLLHVGASSQSTDRKNSEAASERTKRERRVKVADEHRAWSDYEQFKVRERLAKDEAKKNESRFLASQEAYRARQNEAKRQAKLELGDYSVRLNQEAEERRQQQFRQAQQRDKITKERLRQVAQAEATEHKLAHEQKESKRAEQARDMAYAPTPAAMPGAQHPCTA
jgi:hypothetical protein